MAGIEITEPMLPNTKNKKSKKRKQRSASAYEEEEKASQYRGKPSKVHRCDQSEKMTEQANVELQENSPWTNLQLILSLQDQNMDLLKKVDLAFGYVKSSSIKKMVDINRSSQVMSTSRTLVFLNNWVQSVLISSEKKMRQEKNKPEFGTFGSCLDLRCWKMLHFSLEEAKNLEVSLVCSKDFLRVFRWIVMDASDFVKNVSLCCEGTLFAERVEFYDVVLDCITLIFSVHGGVANESLDLWILLIHEVIQLILKFVDVQIDSYELPDFIFKLSCYFFGPFAKFLRVHPTRKNGFHDFVDKLLEPLLHLLYALRHSSYDTNNEWSIDLSRSIEEVLAQGLFHPTHIDGFLILQSSEKYKISSDAPPKKEKLVNRSYHRHLFDKVEKIVAKKNGLALVGLRELLPVFVSSVVKHKAATLNEEGSRQSVVSSSSHVPDDHSQSRMEVSEKMSGRPNMDSELRKSIFKFFVQIMEYLLADVNNYLLSFEEVVSISSEIASTVRSINNLLASFICEKIYLRTEDASEGASRKFLRLIYDTIMSITTKISCTKLPAFGSDENSVSKPLISVKKELIATLHHLLDIEYEVAGDGLESVWTMVLSSLACCCGTVDPLDQQLLLSEILSMSCRLIDLYSELRQVNSSIFALCRALRHSVSLLGSSEVCASSFTRSLSKLLCSSEFRLSLCNAIKAIPEGQAAGCIRQLTSDIIESLEWIKLNPQLVGIGESTKLVPHDCDSLKFDQQAALLGQALSEVYTVILDSITVTSGNSYLVGSSLKNLMKVVGPYLSSIISLQTDSTKEFSIVVNGRILSKVSGCENLYMCWILVLFFRVLLSCRSLARQALCLMAPDASEKMSEVIDDPVTAYSGRDWLEMPSSGKGFFSWIEQPSASLLDLLNSILDISFQDAVVLCPPLVYVSNLMALQRLVDLNRLIKSFEYMLVWNQTQGHTTLNDDDDISEDDKRIRKWKKCLSRMRNEAAGLAKFIMERLSSVTEDHICAPSFDSGINKTFIHGIKNKDVLDFPVSSLDEKSLPCALWWIICQNVDIWCSHAAKKDLKKYLTLLIQASISSINDHGSHFATCNTNSGHLKNVTPHQTGLRLMRNTILLEQKFVRRYMASRFCRILQKTVLSIFATSGVDLSKPPDWSEVMCAIENLSDTPSGDLPWLKKSMVIAECCDKQTNSKFATCQFLLNLLMQMPEEYFSSSSSSLYITCILNLERLLVGSLLGLYNASCSDGPYEIFLLFVSCRKVLKRLIAASCKKNVNESESPLFPRLLNCELPLTWLLKSLYATVGCKSSFADDTAFEVKFSIFSLMNHTSNALVAVSGNLFEHVISFNASAKKLLRERKSLDPGTEESDLSERNLQLNSENLEACKSVLEFAETLADRMQTTLTIFSNVSCDKKREGSIQFQDFYNLSSIIACFHGLLWGLASALRDAYAVDINFRVKFSRYNAELMTRINSCIGTFMNFLTFFLREYFLGNDLILDPSVSDGNGLGAGESSSGDDALTEGEMESTGKMASSDAQSALSKRNTHPAVRDLETFLNEVQGQMPCLKESLLLGFLRGENAEAAFFLQQLFIACSAILRLNLHIELPSISWSFFPTIVGISQFVLLEFSNNTEMPHQFALFCLDGVLSFLDELGTYIPQFDPSLSRDVYTKLMDLHLRAIGKCISLQGKGATLTLQETGAHTNVLGNQGKSCFLWRRSQLHELRARLGKSFGTYVRKASELHLLSSIQAVEKALVGVQEGLMTNYEIFIGNSDGGGVSPLVAAGIECVDLILEYVTGQKRLNVIKRHIQAVVACILNVILHLQAPNIFYEYADSFKANGRPDSGSVILMCIDVLTKISAKPSFYQIGACHIAQSLRVPAALFQYFIQLQISEDPNKALSGISSSNSTIDRKFSIELYVACCRLLCTTLKHHPSETWQCSTLLEDSVCVLLQCLEFVNVDQVSRRDYFAMEVHEAVQCASSLRRVYEEVRQQKDVFGQSSFRFLSRYIWVYCAKNRIIREVDEALRPGIYALIDCCSADDLQLLHTQFEDGPFRTTLAYLQHAYKINFQFEGKI